MVNKDVGWTASVLHWDATTITCIECIRRVRKRAQQRRYRFKFKLLQRNRRQFLTRPQWIADNVEELRQEHLLRIGQGLERTAARLR